MKDTPLNALKFYGGALFLAVATIYGGLAYPSEEYKPVPMVKKFVAWRKYVKRIKFGGDKSSNQRDSRPSGLESTSQSS